MYKDETNAYEFREYIQLLKKIEEFPFQGYCLYSKDLFFPQKPAGKRFQRSVAWVSEGSVCSSQV